MACHRTIWSASVAFTCLVSLLGCSDAANRDSPERADSDAVISLRLHPETQTIRVGDSPAFTAVLVNTGKSDVVLVEPGDGSDCDWRTPLVEWSHPPDHAGGRCGNINSLTLGEVFTLAPGESRELNRWIGEPSLPTPGCYRVTLRYSNEPRHEWVGVPLGEHDPQALEAVRRSSPISVVSNPVEIIVE